MSHPEGLLQSRRDRRAFTLLEVLVVLVLLAVAASLVAPAFPDMTRAREDELDGVIDAARQLAVRNASTVTLSFAPDGRWTAAGSDGSSLAELPGGTLDAGGQPNLRLRVSPLGGCSLDGIPPSEAALSFDPVRCRLRGPSR
jgi:prepilin-type N-terminal cleavage/methylation domain-containing protein